jgi:hypothetical protein
MNAYATKINFEKQYNYITSGGTSNLDLIVSGDDGIQFLTSNATITAAKFKDGGDAYFNYNFGKNYLRNIGIMNMAQVGGNAYPTVGTGSAFHAQVGYLLPKGNSSLRIQPYANVTLQNWEGNVSKDLNNLGNQIGWFANGNVGCNWLIEGHHAKITTDVGLRPDFTTSGTKTRPTFTVQTMIYL